MWIWYTRGHGKLSNPLFMKDVRGLKHPRKVDIYSYSIPFINHLISLVNANILYIVTSACLWQGIPHRNDPYTLLSSNFKSCARWWYYANPLKCLREFKFRSLFSICSLWLTYLSRIPTPYIVRYNYLVYRSAHRINFGNTSIKVTCC